MSTTKAGLLKVIRQKCLECTMDQKKEIAECPIERCPLWPYRFATDPHKPDGQISPAQKASLEAGRAKANSESKTNSR